MKKIVLIIISITTFCQLAFAYTNNFNTTRKECYDAMMIEDYQNKSWTGENVDELLTFLGAYKTMGNKNIYELYHNSILKTMQSYKLPFPSNLCQFVHQIYDNINTNSEMAFQSFYFTLYANNPNVGFVFVDILTNNFGKEYRLPHWKDSIDFYDNCTTVIYNIGTPQIIDSLNISWRKIKADNHRAGYTVDPEKYPEVALDWIFNHPDPAVREHLIARWRDSDRPEAVEVLNEYIVRLENKHMKRILINEILKQVDKLEIKRKNWLKDDMRLPINCGYYSPKSFETYEKKKEEKLRKYAKEKEDYTLKYKTKYKKAKAIQAENLKQRRKGTPHTPKVPQPKSKEEVAAMKKQIKVWQKEGFKGIKKTKPPIYKFWKFF